MTGARLAAFDTRFKKQIATQGAGINWRNLTMKKRVLFILITFLIVPMILLLALEASLYILGFKTTYEREDPFLGFQAIDPLFEKVQIGDATEEIMYVTRKTKWPWFNQQQFKAKKPENGYRVFCFGGSTTFGRPYSFKTSFSNWLQVLLQSLDSHTYYEVVNVGGVSYASYRIINLMKEMVNYEPDLFIVYSGHNEFLEDRTYSDILQETPIVTKLRTQLNRLRTYSLARSIWLQLQDQTREEAQRKFQMTGEVSAILDQSFGRALYHRDPVKEKAILNHFRFNLERMVEIAEEYGVRLLFVVPPSNEKDFSPFKSQFYNSLNAEQMKKWYELYEDGQSKLHEEDYQGALQSFREAAEIDSGYADLRYRMGKCLLALDQYQEAKSEFVVARDFDVAPLRATSKIEQIVREVGQKRGIPTVNLVSILETKTAESLGNTILGRELFFDHAHPTIEVHQLLAEELLKTMLRHKLVESEKSWQAINRTALYESVMASMDSTFYAMRDLNLAKVLNWAGKHEEAIPFIIRAAERNRNHPEAQYLRGLVFQEEGKFEQAEQFYRKTIAIDSTYSKAYNALGTIYEKNNLLDRAIPSFKNAIRYQPDYDHAYYNLGNTFYRKGRMEDAIQAYLQALRLNPNHPKALNNLGGIYMTKKAYYEAIQAFERTLEIEPDNFKAYSNLGVIYFQKGNWDKSQAMFEKVLEIIPDDNVAEQWLKRLKQRNN